MNLPANAASPEDTASPFVGRALPRKEDAALLMGKGRYADDIPAPVGTLYAHILRSPHAHALIRNIDVSKALAHPGVHAVITGDQIKELSDHFLIAGRELVPQWALAVERVRYVGEAVAVVVATSRYVAEDAVELIEVDYEPLRAVVSIREAMADGAPLVHETAGANSIGVRKFSYGDPEKAFAEADKIVRLTTEYPRNSFTPMECFVVVAEYKQPDRSYDVLSNFQGPFSAHPVMTRALRIPGSKLRLRTPPDSGGSFGIKLSVFPYIVLMSLASRIVGRPVKWVEDRLEHLLAASSGPNRLTEIEAAVTNDGKITALRMDQMEDYGAYLRAPMPGPLYRMHGSSTGAYDIKNLEVTNRIILTNKAPAALIRGFGGPQLYLALERLVQRVAVELGLEHIEIIRRNLIPAGVFPYKAAAGALYDSGDYPRAVEEALGDGRLEDLKRRQAEARAAGRHYGIGFATVVEPGMSNMGYLSTLVPASVRERVGDKNGAISLATVNVDPMGAVSVTSDTAQQGQGHATVLSQIVADQLGLKPDDIAVNLEIDTQKDQWSIASGTYSCRFSPGTAVATHLAAERIRGKLIKIAAKQLNVRPEDIELAEGKVRSKTNPDNALSFTRVAGTAHWSPVMLPDGMEPGLRETATWCPPELAPPSKNDEINTSLTYGFVFDMCGIEIDPVTFQVKIDRYISMHDAGKLLNPLLAEGQMKGAFVQGLATALYEEFVYDERGSFKSGTFADYLVPTASEIPPLELMHIECPSPFTPLGAKGLAEGNCMSVPACVANAVADALGVKDVSLPISPRRVHELIAGPEPEPPEDLAQRNVAVATPTDSGREITGTGSFVVKASPSEVWRSLLDPEALRAVIPGCHALHKEGENAYRAEVSLGVGPVRGRFKARVNLSDLDVERSARLSGDLTGPLGAASGGGHVRLNATDAGTRIDYDYAVTVSGTAAAVGGRLLDGAAEIIIRKFFEGLARYVGPKERTASADGGGFFARLWRGITSLFGGGR